jgi:ABC-type Fe3+-citrate transport system substrate-binding protein
VKKRIGACALFLATAMIVGAGVGTAAGAKTFDPTCGGKNVRTVNHTMGTTTITGTPKRIVALEFSFVDDLGAVGVQPVGIADDNDRARVIPKVRDEIGNPASVGLRATPNLETISSLHPDLIIADADRHATLLPQLQKIAPTIVLDSLKQTYRPQLHSAIVIGQAINKCGLMARRVQQSKLIMAKLRAKVPGGEKRTALFGVASTAAFNAHASTNYAPSLLAELGVKSAFPVGAKDEPQKQITLEGLIAMNPDILFVADAQANSQFQKFKTSPLWQSLKAVQGNQVYVVNTNLWSRARGVQASEIIAQQAVNLLYHKYVAITPLPKVGK